MWYGGKTRMHSMPTWMMPRPSSSDVKRIFVSLQMRKAQMSQMMKILAVP
jgi:hypothetical protein